MHKYYHIVSSRNLEKKIKSCRERITLIRITQLRERIFVELMPSDRHCSHVSSRAF